MEMQFAEWFYRLKKLAERFYRLKKLAERFYRLKTMVGVRGFEPPTPASRTQYSTRLSYTPIDDQDA